MSTPTLFTKRMRGGHNSWSPKDLLLIKLISRQPALYNSKMKSALGTKICYKSIWESIAKEMGKDVVACRKRWKNLRDCYIKKIKIFRNGDEKSKHSKWLDGTLSFLDGVVSEKNRSWDETANEVESIDSDNCINIESDDSNPRVNNECETNPETNAIPMETTTFVTQDMIESLLQQKTQGISDMDDVPLVNEMFYKKLDETIDKYTQPKSEFMLYPKVASVHNFGPSTSEQVMNMNINKTPASSLVMTNIVTIDIEPEHKNDLYQNLDRPSTSQLNMNTNIAAPDNVANNEPRPVTPQTLPVITKFESIPENEKQKTLENELTNYRDEHTETFFNEIGAFVSSRFTLKKQAEIRMKVLTLVTNAELEMLEENDDCAES